MADADPENVIVQSSRSKSKRKRLPLVDPDFEYNSDSSSGVTSSSPGSGKEQDVCRMDTVELEKIIAKLHTSSVNVSKYARTCEWSIPYNACVLKRDLKIQRRCVTPDQLLRHFTATSRPTEQGNDYLLELQSTLVQDIVEITRRATKCVDTDSVIFTENENKADTLRLRIDDAVYNMFINYKSKIQQYQDKVEDIDFYSIAQKLLCGIEDWLNYVAHIATKKLDEVQESVYQQLFMTFMNTFGFYCVNGQTENLIIPVGPDGIPCYPDILFRPSKRNSSYWSPVEVKRLTSDPNFKHISEEPERGILKDKHGIQYTDKQGKDVRTEPVLGIVEDEQSEGKPPAKRVRLTKKVCPEMNEDDDEPDVSRADKVGTHLPPEVRAILDTFFYQLLGQILALDCRENSPNSRRIGIGVVGFKVMFVAFYCRPYGNFVRVPETPDGKIEVHVTKPLCILNANDRDEIVKILLLLAKACSKNVTLESR